MAELRNIHASDGKVSGRVVAGSVRPVLASSSRPGAVDAGVDKHDHIEKSLAAIREALLPLHFGSITLTVHEDRVVQIDVTEKKRFRPD